MIPVSIRLGAWSHILTAVMFSAFVTRVPPRFEALERGDGDADRGEVLRLPVGRQPVSGCLRALGPQASS